MKELDELVFEAIDKKMKPVVDSFKKTLKDLQDSNQELVNSSQELVNSNQELVRQVEFLKNRKTISLEAFIKIKQENPGISDKEAFVIAKNQLDNSVDFSW